MQTNEELLQFATILAHKAGTVMQQYFYDADRSDVSLKSNQTLVTTADTQINQMVIDAIREKYPDHGVLGEEQSFEAERTQLWVCDPIDGTHALIQGVPTAVFSLAFVVDGQPQVAVTFDPFQDVLLSAVRGAGAQRNGDSVKVSSVASVHAATIGVTASYMQLVRRTKTYDYLSEQGARILLVPGNVFKSQLVATARVDGYLFPGRSAHDVAAAALIVTEAGGKVTDLDGNEQRYDGAIRGAIISNGLFHDELIQAVNEVGTDNFLGY
jgi:myo-inositol-1(or 4)-monophosphatase